MTELTLRRPVCGCEEIRLTEIRMTYCVFTITVIWPELVMCSFS
jgi:hypothetical protein